MSKESKVKQHGEAKPFVGNAKTHIAKHGNIIMPPSARGLKRGHIQKMRRKANNLTVPQFIPANQIVKEVTLKSGRKKMVTDHKHQRTIYHHQSAFNKLSKAELKEIEDRKAMAEAKGDSVKKSSEKERSKK